MGQNVIYYKGKSYSSGGGGSEVIANPEDTATDTLTKLSVDGDVYEIKSYREITKAEWEALPSSKLSDDILYCITDGGATEPGEYYNPVIYSITEREIGVWIDGKPLYELTLNCGQAPNNGIVNYDLPSNNYEYIMIKDGCLYNPTTKSSLPLNLVRTDNSSLSNGCFLAMEQNQIRVNDGNDRSGFNVYVTIQYTKTTDTPGSGKYTTLGVPSVHYSTDEQVVGTWIDGKPLYQKIIHTSGISMKLNGTYDFTSLFPLTNTVRDITVIGNYLDNDSPNYFSLGQYCGYFNPNEAPAHTLRLSMGSSTQIFEFFITIKYTKTTD